MQNFTQFAPTEVIFGKQTQMETGKACKKWNGHRVFIVYGGGSVVKSGLLGEVEASLEAEGLTFAELGGVVPNPRLDLAEEGVRKALEFKADMILAVGGGSVIDTAKAIAIGSCYPDTPLWDIWMKKVTPETALPVGVVLTIPAAGSEMSDSAVLTNKAIEKKAGLSTELNRVKFAIMNPELAFTLPKYQLTCGIVDIMMHTLERYFIPDQHCNMTDEIAEGLLRVVIKNAKILMKDPKDYNAMCEIMWCGSLSHNGLTGAGRDSDFSVHKIGHTLGARYDVAHGATLSCVWKSWAEYVYQNDIDRFCHFGESVWGLHEETKEKTAVAAINKTVEFFEEIEMPVCLEDLDTKEITEDDMMQMAESATSNGSVTLCKVKELGVQDVYEIFKGAKNK